MRFRSALLVLFLLLSASDLTAQIPQVTEETQVPSPGDGHDYIHWLNETVNPSNGTVTVRIGIPMPSSRQFSVPFYLAYNSGQALTGPAFGFQPNNSSDVSLAGWSYTVPVMTYFGGIYYDPDHPPGTCDYTTDYIFSDASGKSTQMHIASSDGSDVCLDNGFYNVYGMSENYGLLADLGPDEWDVDGTFYKLSTPSRNGGAGGGSAYFASQIEDRNGNLLNIAYAGNGAFTYTDTMGRPVLSSSGFGSGTATLTSTKFSTPYTVTWGTAAYNYSVDFTIDPDGSVNCPSLAPETAQGSMPVISSIGLPNGQSYSFTYDSTYGRLSKITYPSGAYARYVWGWRTNVSQWLFTEGSGFDSYTCRTFYGEPVITDRYVSTDGVTETEHQHFDYTSYYPGFNDVKTTLTDTDLTTGQVVRTVTYNYTDTVMPAPPYESNSYGSPVFDETSEVYAAGSSTLRTVAEAWSPDGKPSYKITTLEDGSTASETVWCYDGNDQLTEKDEFGYSGTGSPGGTCNPNLAPAVGPLMRKTITAYNPSFGQFDGTSLTGQWIVDRPAATTVYDGSGNRVAETDYTYGNTTSPVTVIAGTHDDANYSSSSNLNRANLLSVTNQCFPSCVNAVTSYTYDDTGQVTSTTDPNVNTTTYSYADHFDTGTPPGTTDGYVTHIAYPSTSGVGHQESFTYNYEDGTLATTIDENNQVTRYAYNDPMDRLKSASYPDGGSTSYSYQDAAPMSTTVSQAITSTTSKVTTTTYDGFGREVQTELSSDPDGPTYTATQYDGLGRLYRVWNPTRCLPVTTNCGESTWGYTTYQYDALDRSTQVIQPDGSIVSTNYNLRATEVQDEGDGASRITRISQIDGLGRLASVCEASSTTQLGSGGTPAACGQDYAATGFLTTYGYDALDNLTSVSQGPLDQRSFIYDSLSRLTSSTNPESNWSSSNQQFVPTTYAYDANGNLITKTSPLPNQTGTATLTTTYVYDALDRMTSKSYSDGTPAAYFLYDVSDGWAHPANAIGRLTKAYINDCIKTYYSYDSMGRQTLSGQRTPIGCPQDEGGESGLSLYAGYDFLGDMTSITDGWNQSNINYTYNAAGQPISEGWASNPYGITDPAISDIHYDPVGHVISDTLGDGEIESYSYTNRGWQQSSLVQNQGTEWYGFNISSFAPNGDILAASDSVNGNWTYSYDEFNRLSGSNQNSGAAVYNYAYDRFGNRWQQNGPHTMSLSFSGNNNRMDGYTYDTAGNLLNDGSHSYAYDAENHLIQVDGGNTTTYTYDANGRRVEKTHDYTYSSMGVSDYVYDLRGHLFFTAWENPDGSGMCCNWDLYFGDRHLFLTPGARFSHTDWLGTERVRRSTQDYADSCASLPFGDALSCSADPDRYESILHFTGQQHDFESGLDNFGARYYSSQVGRFMSPDWSEPPEAVPYANLGDPQSLNLYSYVENRPTTLKDDSGHLPRQTCTNTVDVTASGELTQNIYCTVDWNWTDLLPPPWNSIFDAWRRHPDESTSDYNKRMTRQWVDLSIMGMMGAEAEAPEAQIDNLLQELKNGLRPAAEGPALQDIINELYKDTDTLQGGTAGAVRNEIATGKPTGGRWHSTKAVERANQLDKLIKSGTLSKNDAVLAKAIVRDLRGSAAGK